MASATLTPAPPPRPQTRITVEEYRQLLRIGAVPENGRFELIRGIVVERPFMNPPHAATIGNLNVLLILLVGNRYAVRTQTPITLPPDSEPIPEFVIATGPKELYYNRHPGPHEIKIVVEVSDSSLSDDRNRKLQNYAEAGLPEYWIVNIPELQVEVYTEPQGGIEPSYRVRTDYLIDDSVPVVVDSVLIGSLLVREMFPR